MLRRLLVFVAPVALASLFAQDVTAQGRRGASPRGWLGISYSVTAIRTNGGVRETLVIQEVVGNSPAQRAGVEAGDTIVAVNDIRVTEDLMLSVSASIAPGDEVRLRVRRDGRDHDVRIRAGEWPAEYAYALPGRADVWMIHPDSLRGRIHIYLDSARRHIDVLPRLELDPELRLRRYFPDSLRVLPRDSIMVWRTPRGGFSYVFPRDSLRVMRDSMFLRIEPDVRAFQFRMDSLMRLQLDTLRLRRDFDRDWTLFTDSAFVTPRGSFGIAMLGERAIAGAELTELNPGLGEYFGTDRGVLVVRVPEGTPAHRAGLQAGDVIVRANGREVGSIRDLRAEIMRRSARDPVSLEILRKRARLTVQLRQD